MTDKDVEKLVENFGKTLADDGEALGIAIALSKTDSKNLAMSCHASLLEMGYLLSKAVETIMNSLTTEEEIDEFSRGLVGSMRFLNDKKRRSKKHLH